MRLARQLAGRLRGFFRRRTVEAEVEDELRFHLAMQERAGLERGLSAADARRAARLRFGNPAALRELAMDVRGGGWLETAWQDARYALRVLLRAPGFTVVATLTLALGIGANTLVFSVVSTVLLRPLPFAEPDEIVRLYETWPPNVIRVEAAPANFADYRSEATTLSAVAGWLSGANLSLTGMGEPEKLEAAMASASLQDVLGVPPLRGRWFTPAEEAYRASPVAVISHALWQRLFGGDPAALGREIVLDGRPTPVIGVMPAGFDFPSRTTEVWVPMAMGPEQAAGRGDHYVQVIARLRPGFTAEQAAADLERVSGRLRREFPLTNADVGVVVVPLREAIVGDTRRPLAILGGVVVFVLLIACTNVANLLLARAGARRHEMAIRIAVGGGRSRIVRQLVTESAVLGLLGGVAAALVASGGVLFLRRLLPEGLLPTGELQVDARVLAFTAALSLGTGVLLGVLPAFQLSRDATAEALKQRAGAIRGVRAPRLRDLLVTSQVALALVLAVGAVLMTRSYWRIVSVDPGFDPQGVLTMRVELDSRSYDTAERRNAFYDELLRRIDTLPGVRGAGMISYMPMTPVGIVMKVTVEGRTLESGASAPGAVFRVVTPGYFSAVGMRFVRGRGLGERDRAGAPPVMVVNETMARSFWPGEDPIGKRFKIGLPQGTNPWAEVIGVVADVRLRTLQEPVQSQMFAVHWQDRRGFMAPRDLLVRTSGDPLSLARPVRSAIRATDPLQPVARVETMDKAISRTLAQPRFQMAFVGAFGVLALVLASVGVYGVMSYLVTQRRREIGIRMALGAARAEVLRLVVGRGLSMAVAGIALGLSGAALLTRAVEKLLFEVSPLDVVTFVVTPALVLAATLAACYLPALRASRVDPATVLRTE